MTVFLLSLILLVGQVVGDPPRLDPTPPTAKEQARQRALELFARSVLLERDSDLIQALEKLLEEARTLDPDAAPIHAALLQLYLALDRSDEALVAGRRALELTPGQVEVAYLHARHLRKLKKFAEVVAVLDQALQKRAKPEEIDRVAQLALDLAMACEELGDAAKTESALRQALALLEKREAMLETGRVSERELTAMTAETQERIGLVCLKQKKTIPARTAFTAARKLDPERGPRLAYHQALIHEQEGQTEPALAAVEEYLRTTPLGTEGHELKVRLLQKLGRGREAVTFLERASRAEAAPVGLVLLLGREYVRAGRAPEAETLYRERLKTHPTREIAQALVERLSTRGQGEELLVLLDGLLESARGKEPRGASDPNAASQARVLLWAIQRDANATTLLLQAVTQALPNRDLGQMTSSTVANLAARAGQLDLAEKLFRQVLRQLGRERQGEPDAYGGLLRVLRQANKHQAIVDVCRECMNRAADTSRLLFHSYLARAELALGRTREALKAADDAVQESPDTARLNMRLNRAQIRAECGQVAEAVAECHELLKAYNQPGDVSQIRHTLSNVWSIDRKLDRAAEQLKLILKDDPTDATACNDLAYHYAEMNRDLDQAEKLARKALELDRSQRGQGNQVDVDAAEDNGSFLDTLGWVLFRRGKLAEARRELERATVLPGGKESAVIWDHLGDVLARLDERAEARRCYDRSLRLLEGESQRGRDESLRQEIRGKLRVLER